MSAKRFDMARLRTQLLLDQPFFGTLAMHLEFIEDTSVETAQTNGAWVKFNPAAMEKFTAAEQLGVLAHEVLHPALLHPYRRNGRDLREWNEACDFAINSQLVAAGFTLPAGVLIDPQFDGMSAEQIYSKRRSQANPPQPKAEPEPDENEDDEDPEDEEQPQDVNEADDDATSESQEEDGEELCECGRRPDDCSTADGSDGHGDRGGDPGNEPGTEQDGEPLLPGCPTGEFIDGPAAKDEEGDLTAADWEVIAAEAATVAERAGELPGGIGRALKETREPRVDWKAETQAFLTHTVAHDYSWSSPNRRFIGRGLYLPGPFKENVGTLALAIDVSGSVNQQMLDEFAAELSGLLRDARPERLVVVYCDTQIQGTAEFTPDDEVKLEMRGGGGTLFQPVFDWVEENAIDPLGLIYMTDLYGPEPAIPPYPVLWVTPLHSQRPAPFGQLVRMV